MTGTPIPPTAEESDLAFLERMVDTSLCEACPSLTLEQKSAVIALFRRKTLWERGSEMLYLAQPGNTLPQRRQRMQGIVAAFDPTKETAKAYARRVASKSGGPGCREILRQIAKARAEKAKTATG